MRILLIDNTTPELAFFTPLLLEKLQRWGSVSACRSISEMELEGWDAIVLSGSSVNLSDPVSMKHISKDLATLLLFPDVPILGICFGMQLMAMAYGGMVERMPEVRRVDREEVTYEQTDTSVLLAGAASFHVCFSHEDAVTRCPPKFTSWSTRPDRLDILESESLLRFGVQFHPEKSDETCPVLEHFFAFVRRRATTLSVQSVRTIEDLMGRARPQQLATQHGVQVGDILDIWASFRKRYHIPAMLL